MTSFNTNFEIVINKMSSDLIIKKCDRCFNDVCVPNKDASVNHKEAYHVDSGMIECDDIKTVHVHNESFNHSYGKWQILKYKKLPLRTCNKCFKTESERLDLNDAISWKDEVRCGKRFVIDLVCNVKEKEFIFIEVKYTHACTKKKVAWFKYHKCNWMEVDTDLNYLRGSYCCKSCNENM